MALSLEQYRCGDYEDTEIKVKDILTQRIKRQRKKSLGVSIKNGNKIPEDLIIEILSRLSVKALLQFKSVCKLWYDIIKSSCFISKHLRNYYDNNNNWRDCLIVQFAFMDPGEPIVYELLIDDTKNRALSYQEIKTPICNTYMCGPCDGIYYLWRFDYLATKRSLWNPALNEFMVLPDFTWKPTLPLVLCSTHIHEHYGFGYDSKTNDYKVIAIFDYHDTPTITNNLMSVLIYSLRSNSWRYWGDLDKYSNLEWNKSYVFVNGCYYWIASLFLTDGLNCEMIVSFDFSADTCQEIPLPKFETRPKLESQLIVYQDSIAFVSVPYENTSFSLCTWNEEVWTQKLSMKLDFTVWGAFSIWRDDMLVFRQGSKGKLLSWDKLVLCDTTTKQIFFLDQGFWEGSECENICAYKESLVSIKDFGKDNQA